MRYETEENAVEIVDATFTTYTRGTAEPLYRGEDEKAARESLEMSDQDWHNLLMSDPS